MTAPLWKFLGFASQQQHAAQVGANKRRIRKINARLHELNWFAGYHSKEGERLSAERDKLIDQLAPTAKLFPLPETA